MKVEMFEILILINLVGVFVLFIIVNTIQHKVTTAMNILMALTKTPTKKQPVPFVPPPTTNTGRNPLSG